MCLHSLRTHVLVFMPVVTVPACRSCTLYAQARPASHTSPPLLPLLTPPTQDQPLLLVRDRVQNIRCAKLAYALHGALRACTCKLRQMQGHVWLPTSCTDASLPSASLPSLCRWLLPREWAHPEAAICQSEALWPAHFLTCFSLAAGSRCSFHRHQQHHTHGSLHPSYRSSAAQ